MKIFILLDFFGIRSKLEYKYIGIHSYLIILCQELPKNIFYTILN